MTELMWVHEKRDWKLDRRTIQHRVKAVRSQCYRLRDLMAAQKCQVLLTKDLAATLKRVANTLPNSGLRVNVVVGRTTLPKISARV